MNSELGMLLPFAAVMFVMWCGTRIVLRWIDRSRVSPVNAERRLHELSDRLDRLEKAVGHSGVLANTQISASDGPETSRIQRTRSFLNQQGHR